MEADDLLTTTITTGPLEVVCVATGEIDPITGPRLEGEILVVLADAEVSTLVLDLAGVTFIDSSGLRVVIDLHKVMRARGGRLVLRRPSATVSRLLEITNLTASLDIEG